MSRYIEEVLTPKALQKQGSPENDGQRNKFIRSADENEKTYISVAISFIFVYFYTGSEVYCIWLFLMLFSFNLLPLTFRTIIDFYFWCIK